jgi:pyruvate,orthophosphate dikinase
MVKWVYAFGGGKAEGEAGMTQLLGSKGAGLAEMSRLGLAVPPGFTITTEACTHFLDGGRNYPADLKDQVSSALRQLGYAARSGFGDPENPLLVSVRSGARVSMPGMMDTVLNLGLNAATVEGLAQLSGDARFAYDSYRRFIQMYAGVVLGIDPGIFENILDDARDAKGVELDTDLDAEDLRTIAGLFVADVQENIGQPFPQDVGAQLWGAIAAVFVSWQSQRAQTYRRLNGIPEDGGTAVTVQAMVFGNRGQTSATGVAFTRDPATGERLLFGEFLINAQGEDVVAGARTPQPISRAMRERQKAKRPSMEEAMPETFAELKAVADRLEAHIRDVQDLEFTVQEGQLFMLQTRTARRTPEAALKAAIDMAQEGLIDRKTAIARIDPAALEQLMQPSLDPEAPRRQIATGLGASPGAACGAIVFTAEEAQEAAAAGRDTILVRTEASPGDIHGMQAARGLLTARGGMTSHAAVLARGMARPCVCGAGTLKIDPARGQMIVDEITLARGAIITIDGASGAVFLGRVKMRIPERGAEFVTLMQWVDEVCGDSEHDNVAISPFRAPILRLMAAQAALKK